MNWLLDPSFSTYGADIDRLYYIILVITGIVFVVTEGLLIWFLIRYRRRDGQKAEYSHGSVKAEVIWTAVPFVIVLGLALMSKGLWDQVKDSTHFPDDAYEVLVTARQFEWISTYAGADGEFGTADDFTLTNRVQVPVNRPVLIHLEAEDVIHSFFVPDFRVKQDAVPGMRMAVWFEVTEPGEYTLGCAELCGIGHYRMRGTIDVLPQAEFQAWEAEQIALHSGAGVSEVADGSAGDATDPPGPEEAAGAATDENDS
jgi:cytochrome c oxidase subunit II